MKIPKTGIALAHGDCPENVVPASPIQAKPSSGEGEITSPSLASQKSTPRRETNCGDKDFQRDNNDSVRPDQVKDNFRDPCFCCRQLFRKQTDGRSGGPTRVIYWETPKPKFGGTSVTACDYRPHELPKREVPKWHPHRAQSWKWLDVPSVKETTYRKDYVRPLFVTRRLPLRPKPGILRLL